MRIVLLILLLASSSTQAASLARADSLYALRSQGADGDRALRTTITAAIAAYEEVAAEQPQSIEIKWKLLRALFFEGQYTGYSRPERQAWYAEAVDRAEESLAEAAELCGGSKTWKRGRRAQVARHCDPDDAAQLYLWSAVAWAQWGRASGPIDAVRRGMAAKLNDYAQRVIELDPHCEQGGGQRLLASLHARLPKVPLITSFVRREQAIPLATAALEIDPHHPGNRYIYATVLLRVDPERHAEAEAVLRALAEEEASGPYRVEWHNLSRRAQRWLDGDYGP
ncbi:MAG: hypothetical protein VXW00_07030 [Candidatus Latescibacterota bacterium]|nr:hypothetical protein [Candidatus Latescibacterota bacterium]